MILLEVDPDLVKPGWTPLIITVLLGVAVVLLFFSMRRQFRKISIPRDDEVDDPADPRRTTRRPRRRTPRTRRRTTPRPPARTRPPGDRLGEAFLADERVKPWRTG